MAAAQWSDAVFSTYTSTSNFDMANNNFTTTELIPLACIAIGMVITFTGYRYSRVLCFLSGLVFGWMTVYWLFTHQTNIQTTTVPIIVGILISTSIAVMFLLLPRPDNISFYSTRFRHLPTADRQRHDYT